MERAPEKPEWADEGALIAELFAPLTNGLPGACDLKDDAAWLSPPPGHDIVVSTDGLIEGVHFVSGANPADVGWKALAVNVSDLVAKGAAPLVYLMNIALPADRSPRATADWLRGFAGGLSQAQSAFGCVLTGGDTDRTPGPLSVTITALGSLPAGTMTTRKGARPGDVVCVCGDIGDAHLGLRLELEPALRDVWQLSATEAGHLKAQFHRPTPPFRLAGAIAQYASAAMDISDGFVADLSKLVNASCCAAEINAAKVPVSAPAAKVLATGSVSIADLMTGGEDYTILATFPEQGLDAVAEEAARLGYRLTAIGRIAPGGGLVVLGDDGLPMQFARGGWDHLTSGHKDSSDLKSSV